MNKPFSAQGHCLCNATSFKANVVSTEIGVCHCNMCRTWSGGPYIGLDCGVDVSFDGEVTQFDSSDWAERGFCQRCGTHLYYKFKSTGQYIMPAGLFADDAGLLMDHQIFIDEKPNYYEFANATKNLTGAEVIEQFASLAPES